MDTNARSSPVGLSVAPIVATSPLAAGNDPSSARTDPTADRADRYRLVIEEGPARGTFVYKTLDSVTGEVVRQFPREELIRLSASDTYAKGMVADTAA